MWRDAETRMDELTAPRRLEPLEHAELGPRASEAIERLRILHNLPNGSDVHGFYATLARTPEVFASYLRLGSDISTESALPARARELAILRTGWLCGAPYQYGEHVRAAKRIGLTAEDLARVREGAGAQGWSEGDRAVLAAAEELHARAMLSDEVWAQLAAQFDERQCVELLFVVGHYHLTAFVQNALRIPLSASNEGLAAE
jgi:4-carboxymuconolactone decarboxylase